MGICQIIMIFLFGTSFMSALVHHGKPKQGYHNFGIDCVALAIQLSLLYFGGFFS